MKYKLLKDLPKLNKGHVFRKEGNNYVNNDSFMKHICCVQEVEDNLDWFAPYLFTTEDNVDIYLGDEIWVVDNRDFISSWFANENSNGKIFSTQKAAKDYLLLKKAKLKYPIGTKVKDYAYSDIIHEIKSDVIIEREGTIFIDEIIVYHKEKWLEKYIEPKFKVGDIVVFTPTLKTGKILGKLEDEEYCITTLFKNVVTINKLRLATNDEIIEYYQDLGWIKGAKFIYNGVIYYVRDIFPNGQVIGLTEDEKEYITRYIENCVLIKYPKSWEDLKGVHGYALGEGRIWKDFEYCNNYASHKIFNTSKQAESALAFAQLSQLVAEINGDWVADWSDKDQIKHVVVRRGTELSWGAYNRTYDPLPFKSAELRDFSFEHHKELWNKYYQL